MKNVFVMLIHWHSYLVADLILCLSYQRMESGSTDYEDDADKKVSFFSFIRFGMF